jgi:YggT family protein
MLRYIGFLLEIYIYLLIARALLSWFSASASPDSALGKINKVLYALTEPVLKPIRRVIPPVRIGGAYLDLSVLVLFVFVQFVLLRFL